jgi:hypothetical protein
VSRIITGKFHMSLGPVRLPDVIEDAGHRVTGYANSQDRVDALRAGFQMHVSKPVTPSELAAAVASLVVDRVRSAG